MKKFVAVLICLMFVGFGSVAYAGHNDDCPPNNPNCNGDNTGGGDIDIDIDNDVDVDVDVDNDIDIDNTNVNIQGQIQGQDQDQEQSQGQEQGQSQSINFSQKFEDKRDHVNPNQYQGANAALQDGNAFDHKAMGSVFQRVRGLTMAQAEKLGKDATDVEIDVAVMFDREDRTDSIKRGSKGDFMGYIYLTPTGEDVSFAGMEGRAAVKAMWLGATHMKLAYYDTGNEATGSSWNIGLGGGASILTGADDNVAIAPNGGLGFGSAKAGNEERPALVYELSFDKDSLPKPKVSMKAETKKVASSDDCKWSDFETWSAYQACKEGR